MYQEYYHRVDLVDGGTSSINAVNPTDIVNLRTLDLRLAGRNNIKEAALAATDTNIDLAVGGLLVVDGYQTVEGDRILVKSQTDATQNGLYYASTGVWVRTEDANEDGEVLTGMTVFVKNSLANSNNGYIYVMNSASPVVIGTNDINFVLHMEVAGTAEQVSVDDSSFVNITGSDAQTALADIDAQLTNMGNDTIIGAGSGATDLGTFSGSTLSDNTTVKNALQELETKVEQNDDIYATNGALATGVTLTAGGWTVVAHGLGTQYLASATFFDEGNSLQNLNGSVLWRPFGEDPTNSIEVYSSHVKTISVMCRV